MNVQKRRPSADEIKWKRDLIASIIAIGLPTLIGGSKWLAAMVLLAAGYWLFNLARLSQRRQRRLYRFASKALLIGFLSAAFFAVAGSCAPYLKISGTVYSAPGNSSTGET